MINKQLFQVRDFPVPEINLEGYKEITNFDVAPGFEASSIKWGSLLGMDNDDILRLFLFSSPKLIENVKNTRRDFKINYNNYKKYPKIDEEDWL